MSVGQIRRGGPQVGQSVIRCPWSTLAAVLWQGRRHFSSKRKFCLLHIHFKRCDVRVLFGKGCIYGQVRILVEPRSSHVLDDLLPGDVIRWPGDHPSFDLVVHPTACTAFLRLARCSHWSARRYKVPQWGGVLRSRTASPPFPASLIVRTGCSSRAVLLKLYLRLRFCFPSTFIGTMKERRLTQPFVARCKLVLVGDIQCGKTAMLQVLAKDCYPEVSGWSCLHLLFNLDHDLK